MVRAPTSSWTQSMSFFCTSGVSIGEPRVLHQAVIGPVNCWKKCSIPPGPPPSGSVRPKQPIFSKRAIAGTHFFFCSSDPSRVDGAHCETTMNPEECRDRRVDAGQLHRDEAEQLLVSTLRSRSLQG